MDRRRTRCRLPAGFCRPYLTVPPWLSAGARDWRSNRQPVLLDVLPMSLPSHSPPWQRSLRFGSGNISLSTGNTPHPSFSGTFATSPVSRSRAPAKLRERLGLWPGSARSGQSMFLRRWPGVFTVHFEALVPSSDPGPGGGISGIDPRGWIVAMTMPPRHAADFIPSARPRHAALSPWVRNAARGPAQLHSTRLMKRAVRYRTGESGTSRTTTCEIHDLPQIPGKVRMHRKPRLA